ncbi:MAG: O-antigen ligase family protein [Oscillospiraceae bacterium]|nr:O-antigen ligase family protein [Oscillospiraceae bacterium]
MLKKQTQAVALLERFFPVFLFVNPFLDVLNGFLMNIKLFKGSPVTFSLAVRLLVLAAMGLYLLLRRDRGGLLLALAIGLAGAVSVAGELLSGVEFSPFADAQYIAKFAYNLVAYLVYAAVLDRRHGGDREGILAFLDRIFTWTTAWMSLSLLLPFLFKLGFEAYWDVIGIHGEKGFFYSGNEATAMLVVLFPLILRGAVTLRLDGGIRLNHLWRLLLPALAANALFLIGTKTAFIGLFLSGVMLSVYALAEGRRKKNWVMLYNLVCVAGIVALLYVSLDVISSQRFSASISGTTDVIDDALMGPNRPSDDIYNEMDEFTQAAVDSRDTYLGRLLSGRLGYLRVTAKRLAERPLSVLIGLGRGSQAHTVEMDIFEMFFYYGLFGFFLLGWPYARQLVLAALALWKQWDFRGYCAMVSLTVTFGYFFLAGHVLFTVTGGFYFALTLLYACVNYGVAPPAARWPIWRRTAKGRQLGR